MAAQVKDISFKNIFKGSVLISALIDHDQSKFRCRDQAVSFAQTLLASGHLRSLGGTVIFEDGVHLYKWADSSVVSETKKNIMTNSTHIPKKKLIELVDLQQGGLLHKKDFILEKVDDKVEHVAPKIERLRRTNSDNRKTQRNSQNTEVNNNKVRRSSSVHQTGYTCKRIGEKLPQKEMVDHICATESVDVEVNNNGLMHTEYEQRLLDELATIKVIHGDAIEKYKCRINDLEGELVRLRKEINNTPTKMSTEVKSTNCPEIKNTPISASPPPPPPPPSPPNAINVPPPPPLPLTPCKTSPKSTLSKSVITPSSKMRPLFWERLVAENSYRDTIWKEMNDIAFDTEEFESLFGRNDDNRRDTSSRARRASVDHSKSSSSKKVAKILEDSRSRAVGIRMRSLRFDMSDIKQAVDDVDFSKVDLDALQSLRKLCATPEELEQILRHQKQNRHVPLDKPEQCLLDLSQIDKFAERVDCLVFRKHFNDQLVNLHQQLQSVSEACKIISNNSSLTKVLGLILCFGNHMNGGTHRGQADGFNLAILPKLKDVKSMDNNFNLLQYVIKVHNKAESEALGETHIECPLPDPASLQQASCIAFKIVKNDLDKLSKKLNLHKLKAEAVYRESKQEYLLPFRDLMEQFFSSAQHAIKTNLDQLVQTSKTFDSLIAFYGIDEQQIDDSDLSESTLASPDAFFRLWMLFLEDYRKGWQDEQKRIAKEIFTAMESKRREALINKRRNSYAGTEGCTYSSNLKQKFTSLRKHPDQHANPSCKVLQRSVSIANLQCSEPHTRSIKSKSNSEDLEGFMDETYKGLGLHKVRRSQSVSKLDSSDVSRERQKLTSISDSNAFSENAKPVKTTSKVMRSKIMQDLSQRERPPVSPTYDVFGEEEKKSETAKSPTLKSFGPALGVKHTLQKRRLNRTLSCSPESGPKPLKSLEQDRQMEATNVTPKKPNTTIKIYLRPEKSSHVNENFSVSSTDVIDSAKENGRGTKVYQQVRRRRSCSGPVIEEMVKRDRAVSEAISNIRSKQKISFSELDAMDGVMV